MIKDITLCKCHKQPVRSKVAKGKRFGFGDEKKYFCTVTGTQLFNGFIHAKMRVDLPDPDDTKDGSVVECPEDLEKELEDFKKKAAGNGDDRD